MPRSRVVLLLLLVVVQGTVRVLQLGARGRERTFSHLIVANVVLHLLLLPHHAIHVVGRRWPHAVETVGHLPSLLLQLPLLLVVGKLLLAVRRLPVHLLHPLFLPRMPIALVAPAARDSTRLLPAPLLLL